MSLTGEQKVYFIKKRHEAFETLKTVSEGFFSPKKDSSHLIYASNSIRTGWNSMVFFVATIMVLNDARRDKENAGLDSFCVELQAKAIYHLGMAGEFIESLFGCDGEKKEDKNEEERALIINQ